MYLLQFFLGSVLSHVYLMMLPVSLTWAALNPLHLYALLVTELPILLVRLLSNERNLCHINEIQDF